jgi:hypothetical protein
MFREVNITVAGTSEEGLLAAKELVLKRGQAALPD